MTPLELALTAAVFCALSGVPALSGRLGLFAGRRVACALTGIAAAFGLAAAGGLLLQGRPAETVAMAWQLPVGELCFRIDNLSAFFMVPVLIVAFCVVLYSCGYCATSPDNRAEARLTFYLGLAVAAILLQLLSANGITMLVFWEAMTLLLYLCMGLEHGRSEVRQAGLHYLAASHLTTLLMIVLFSLLSRQGGLQFPAGGSLDPRAAGAAAVFLTALAAFGIKAGIMPLHVWLPSAHANAPSHISAIMSGVVIKMGVYGLLRVISFYSAPPLWWGVLLLCLGMVSAVTGVLFAIGQHDIKRLLAYHSIENIGIIVMGTGVALTGLAIGMPLLYLLGMAGALLHVLNHSLFKSLLFMGAGVAIHTAGTRDIDRMGGLSRALPLTSAAFLVGAVAICGLPPLNGFVSEFLVYLGIFKGFGTTSGTPAAFMALAAPLLALTGGLALACFVKVFGSVFLGEPRAELPPPHESPAATGAMGILAGLCILIGLVPWGAVRLLEPVLADSLPSRGDLARLQETAHLHGLGIGAAVLIGLTALLAVWYAGQLKRRPRGESGTWDCGYAAPAPTMQYTASSFAEMLVGIFAAILRPRRHEPNLKALFPAPASFESHVPEVVLDKGLLPLFSFSDRHLARIRRLQSGQLNHYILYIFVTLIALLALSDFL